MDLSKVAVEYPDDADIAMARRFYDTLHWNNVGKVALGFATPDKKWIQRIVRDDELDFSMHLRKDCSCYVTVNDLYSGAKTSEAANVSMINGLFFDTDIHGEDDLALVDDQIKKALAVLQEKIDEGLFPKLSMLTLSGRGMGKYLLYETPIDSIDSEEVERHERVYRAMIRRLGSFWKEAGLLVEEDGSVTNENRVCRLPGTLNVKAGRVSMLSFADGDKVTLDELESYFTKEELEYEEEVQEKKQVLRTCAYGDIKAPLKMVVSAPSKMDIINRLMELRGGYDGNMRQNALYIFYNQARLVMNEEEAREATEELNDSFTAPLRYKELVACVFNGTNLHREKGRWAGDDRCHSDGVYLFGYDKIREMLNITEEESAAVGIPNWRKDRAEKKYRKEMKSSVKEDVFAMRKAGESVAAIMKKTGKSRDTIYRWLKEAGLEKKQFKHTRKSKKSGGCAARTDVKMSDFLPNNKSYIGNTSMCTHTCACEVPFLQDEEMRHAYNVLTSGRNVLLHGKAGTGKTTLMKYFCEQMEHTGKHVTMVAATGLAAANVNGNTVHSFFTLSTKEYEPSRYVLNSAVEALMNTDVLVIEEVGTLRFDYFAEVVKAVALAETRYEKQIQVVLCGDFFQTFPVIPADTKDWLEKHWGRPVGTGHAYKATAEWAQLNLAVVCLDTVHRQTEVDFLQALDMARVGDSNCTEYFNNIEHVDMYSDFGVHLCPHRHTADEINRHFAEMHRTMDGAVTYRTEMGEIALIVGAPIIATRNTSSYKNGEMGVITKLNRKSIMVSFDGKAPVRVAYTKDYHGQGMVLPVELGYAITIHRAQGKTFDRVVIHTDFFGDGMAYVAFSRVRTKAGIRLAGDINRRTFVRNYSMVNEIQSVLLAG